MIKFIKQGIHFAIWFIASIIVFMYGIFEVTPELFPILVMSLFVVAIFSYFKHKIQWPLVFGAISLATILVWFLVI